VATEVLPILEAEARERQITLAGTRPNGVDTDLREIIPQGTAGRASERAAELVGVNPRYISDAKRIKEDAPEVFTELQAGALTMPQARAPRHRATHARVQTPPAPA